MSYRPALRGLCRGAPGAPCTLVTSPAAWSAAQQPSTPSYPRHPSARTPLDTSRPSSPKPRPATLGTHMHYTHTCTQSQTGRQSGVGHIDTHPHAHLLPTHTLTFCRSSNRCSFMPPLPFARGVPKFRSRARPAGTGLEQGPRAGAGRHSGRTNVLLYGRETERWMQEWIRLPGILASLLKVLQLVFYFKLCICKIYEYVESYFCQGSH